MSTEQQMLYDLINGLTSDMKEFSRQLNETREQFISELNETRILISKYNGLREQIGERDILIEKLEITIRKLDDKVVKLESKIDKIDNTSKGKQQAFEYIRKWTPWIIMIASILYAYLAGGN